MVSLPYLDAAIGKVDTVLSGGVVVVPVLAVGEDGAVVRVLHAVLVVVHWGKGRILVAVARGGGRVGRGGNSASQKGGGKSNLKQIITFKDIFHLTCNHFSTQNFN